MNKGVSQTLLAGDENGVYGNCLQAAASAVDLVGWLDDLLDQYDKARAEEGALAPFHANHWH